MYDACTREIREIVVIDEPGKSEFIGLIACLFVCLIFAAGLVYVDIVGSHSVDRGVGDLLFVGFTFGAIVFAAWAARSLLVRRRTLRTYRLDGGTIVWSNVNEILWREPADSNYFSLQQCPSSPSKDVG